MRRPHPRTRIAIATAAAGAALALALASCGEPSVTDEPDQTSSATGSATASPNQTRSSWAPSSTAAPGTTRPPTSSAAPTSTQPNSAAPTSGTATVGDTIELRGIDESERIKVTLVRFVDPASGATDLDEPAAGKRFVAAQFRLNNVGTATYDDSPSNGATVIDSDGQQFDSSLSDVSAGQSFAASTTIAPGDTALGYISFEVTKDANITRVQFALDSGFADQKGEWTVD